jgi:tRNA nucleotidyltransferase (CCA-adding enzyme)
LSRYGDVSKVGASFGVIKLRLASDVEYDFSLPRLDNKSGKGHKGFNVEVSPTLSLRSASLRRDWTINAMAWEVFTHRLHDYFGGLRDLKDRVLRPVSKHFSEDPLRVLRGFQFAGRFDMSLASDYQSVMYDCLMEFGTISRERIWSEWEKWALKSIKPSAGLRFLRSSGWLIMFPEVAQTVGVKQSKIHHPEGDVWTHTLHVIDEMTEICMRENITGERRLALMFGTLLHDVGKTHTTITTEFDVTAHGHDEAGVEPATNFMTRLLGGSKTDLVKEVVSLVKCHMQHNNFQPQLSNPERFVRRLSKRVNIENLALIVEADYSGRPPLDKGMPESMKRILEISRAIEVNAGPPAPVMMGRHLIQMGLFPGPQFKKILDEVYERQLDGEITDLEAAVKYVRSIINKNDVDC